MSSDLILKGFPKGFYTKVDGRKGFQKTTSGLIVDDLKETYGNRLEYNLLRLQPEIDRIPLDGHFIENFYVYLNKIGWSIRKGEATDALLVASHDQNYHPVVDDLKKIEEDNSIYPIDLNFIAQDYLGTSDRLSDEILKTTLKAAVGRAFNNGCKFDAVCVLQGKPDVRKSTFWKVLGGDYFCDTFQESSKDNLMMINQNWIIELSEIDGITSKKDHSNLKAMLSSPISHFRAPYERSFRPHPRPSIFVATSNRLDFLIDPTGNRRFWVVKLNHDPTKGEVIDISKLKRDRKRILKAAILAYRKDPNLFLSRELQNQSDVNNLNFEHEHHFYAGLYNWVHKGCRGVDDETAWSTEDAIHHSGCKDRGHIISKDTKDAADILRRLGYVQDKHQGYAPKGKSRPPRLWRKSSQTSQE